VCSDDAGGDVKDLVVLAADKNIEHTIRGLLSRSESIGIRAIGFDVYVHPERDPGCLGKAHDLLRSGIGRYEKALVVFDRDGCGAEGMAREDLERRVESHLFGNGWDGRGAVVVLDPELEILVWSDSPVVDDVLGWSSRNPALRDWLSDRGYLRPGEAKPTRPKEAFQDALRVVSKARSSAIFQSLAERVSVERCVDAAFAKLRATLQGWFPVKETS
jgi:hypothetical protein